MTSTQPRPTTTDAGIPVASQEHSLTVGPDGPILLNDSYLIEQMANFNRERIPERQPHAKGSGAFGHFQVTGDVSAYTRAAAFQPGTRTDTLIRFSTVAGERGSPDTWRDPRGYSLRFYTTEGNAAVAGHRLRHAGGQRVLPLSLLQRSPLQFVKRPQRGEFSVGRDHVGRESGQQRVGGGSLPVQFQTDPVVRQQPSRRVPVTRGLGVADRLHRIPMAGEPAGGGGVQPGELFRCGASQLQLQQVGEHLVVAEPGPPRVQRDDERARLLQILQDPFGAPLGRPSPAPQPGSPG
jgi:Catalase